MRNRDAAEGDAAEGLGFARRMTAFPLAAALLLVVSSARGDDATDLLFLYADETPGGGYGGAGWLHAPGGLDRTGPVFSAEAGRSFEYEARVAAMAGWRLAWGRTITTVLGGLEAGSTIRPVASVDVWLDDAGWMATARAQVTPDYMSWRAAVGWKAGDGLPWFGPELSSTGDERTRFGAHATGVRLPWRFEARASAGWSAGGTYGELSLWRRF
ncbi:MAG: hypothetical protein ACOYJQ_14935 [Pseudochelatococcus sp.]|jgi:hypothetical protein|uniref:hypothetical protein n=1 Tax=Pseudochelatococcus sp. TaxID=2020869 RepID=UPI003D8D662C